MSDTEYHTGQRLSLNGHLCAIWYIGLVADKLGVWLGVEWDDPARGKHNGSHNGKKYFECRNPSSTAASFLKPNQQWDQPRTFLQALRGKYMPEDSGTGGEIVYFSSKKAEEIGFDKFAKRQAQLQGIRVIVLDHMRIRGDLSLDDKAEISKACGHVTDLDLGSNLFESLDEFIELVACLPKLSTLVLDGNRFSLPAAVGNCIGIRSLALSNTWFTWREIALVTQHFPNLSSLYATHNGLSTIPKETLPDSLQKLDLSNNNFSALCDLHGLLRYSNLEDLALKQCNITAVWSSNDHQQPLLPESIQSIDLRNNQISSWLFFDELNRTQPKLKHLQISGNVLYKDLVSPDGRPLTSEDGYMLTIARLPQLETLNYSKITDKERLNAETYYLGQIAIELSRAPVEQTTEILSKHPRWQALCEDYGEPVIQRRHNTEELDPNSLVAKLVVFTFHLAPGFMPEVAQRSWNQEFPKSFNIYALLGLVGKRLGVMPLKIRLVWETGEHDPLGLESNLTELEWWDSSDEENDEPAPGDKLVAREVALVAGTRPVGTYIEGRTATVRVEMKQSQIPRKF